MTNEIISAISWLKSNIAWLFIKWYFYNAPVKILKIWRNYLIFGLNYFSVGLLIKTYFSYWHRYYWSYGRGFDINRYLSAFFSNLISRIIGVIVRTVLVVIGIAFEIIIFVAGLFTFLGWFLLPLAIIILFILGFELLLSL